MENIPMNSTKRPRTASSSSSLATSTDLSGSPNPPHKAHRILPSAASSYAASTTSSTLSSGSGSTVTSQTAGAAASSGNAHPILCNLPPTCHHRPTPIANTNDLERHYAMYHAHVCELKGCGCVFPEARLLELHQTECHDPIAALRKERNEKIFECHIPSPTCGRSFLTPKARRLHLIQAHAFPKQYFFAVTNKGIGGLLKRWGEGASLVRKEWKPREGQLEDIQSMGNLRDTGDDMVEDDDEEDATGEIFDEDESDDDDEPADLEATPRIRPKKIHPPQQPSHHTKPSEVNQTRHTKQSSDNAGLASLTDSLNSLSLVPNAVRFGRGGKTAGFTPSHNQFRGPRGAPRGKPAHLRDSHVAAGTPSQLMDVDPVPGVQGGYTGRGRGFPPRGRPGPSRGRGRGRGV